MTDFRMQVEIGLLHDMAVAKSVGTEPLTSDDWEIIVRQLSLHSYLGSHHGVGNSRLSR
jgi:hypothetical protein